MLCVRVSCIKFQVQMNNIKNGQIVKNTLQIPYDTVRHYQLKVEVKLFYICYHNSYSEYSE